ncbi:branched-chain amino acid ABC transporter permease [Castellaniella sp. GW247-6E4]|uniref:branched-chain amino acid ABC transporter permease n=1 Tax=Castellaniella sp. GW247-6E4 TaxID=3140380 RepID=UPI0033147C5D
MSLFTLILFSGLTMGAIYALLGVGIVLIRNATGILNLAAGDCFLIGAFLSITLSRLHVPLAVIIITVLAVQAILGYGIDFILERWMARATLVIKLLGTVAIAVVLSGLELLLWGRNPTTMERYMPTNFDSGWLQSLDLQSATLIAGAVIVGIALFLFLDRTSAGRAMRAAATDSTGAAASGVNVTFYRISAFVLAGMIAGLGGLLAAPIILVDFTMGLGFALLGLIAALIGGMTILGTLAAGLTLGAIEALVTVYGSDVFRDAVVFALLIAYLLTAQGITFLGEARK